MFDVAEPDTSDLHDDDISWLETVRDGIDHTGQYIVFRDDDRVCVVAVSKEWTRVGRSIAADIRLDDPTVSRRHALMCRQGGSVRVLDDRSLNGLFLNGVRVEWHDLQDGDELVVGRYSLHFIDTAVGQPAVGSSAQLRNCVTANYSVETDGSVCSRSGTDIRKCDFALAAIARTR